MLFLFVDAFFLTDQKLSVSSPLRRLAVVTTHPVQYIAPWFRALAARADTKLHVIYFRELDQASQGAGFGHAFQWDVPLREGYESESIQCVASWRSLPLLALRLLRALRAARPDAVLITGWNEIGLLAAYPITKLMGLPILLRGESNSLRSRGRVARFLHRQILQFADAVLTIGKANREFYLDAGVDASLLFPGAYFVESARLLAMADTHSHERDALRGALGFDAGDCVFAFCGKHVPFKRPMMLIEAAALLRGKGLPVKLLIAGSGELTDALKQRAAELGVPVAFTGFLNQTELWKAYVPADAFVLPSNSRETWGLVTNEAMLFGLPVIVSDQVGCGPDLVIENETGYIFCGQAEDLAAAMEQLLAQGARMREMGGNARQHVLDHYAMANATAGLEAALEVACR